MKINKLRLKNYGPHTDSSFKFRDGFNVLSGPNGQGKSFIIRAINFALINKNFANIDNDRRWGEDNFLVEFEAEKDSNIFKEKITYDKKKGTSKELTVNESIITGNQDVNNMLASYFDPSLTQAGVMSLQGKMDIVNATDSERREVLKKIYNLDFTNGIKNLKEEVDELEQNKSNIEKEIYNLENKTYDFKELKEVPLTTEEYEVKKQKLEKLQSDKALQDNKVSERKKILSDIEYWENTLQNKRKAYQETNSKIKELKEKLERAKEDKDNKLKQLNEKYDEVKSKHDGITLSRVKKFDEEKLKEKESEKQDVYAKLKSKEESLNLVKQGKCPTCGREFHTNVEDIEKEYNEIKASYDKVCKEVEELKEEKRDIEKKQEEAREKRQEKENLKEKLNDIHNQISEVKERDIDSAYRESIKSNEEALTTLQSEGEEAKEKVESLKQELPEEVEEVDYDSKINEISELIDNYNKIKTQNKLIEEENEKLEKQKEEDKKELGSKYKEKDSLNKSIEDYNKGIEILKKEFPNYVISKMTQKIEDGMNLILEKAYGGRYTVKVKESKRGLKVTYGPEEEDIKLSSGAEQNLFNIGFKNAFSEIAGLRMLILDEALNFADDDIAKQTMEVLYNMIEDGILDQVFVITHKESVKETIEGDFKGKIFNIQEGEVL